MSKPPKHDPQFEIEFFEAVHQRCPAYTEVVGLLGGEMLLLREGRVENRQALVGHAQALLGEVGLEFFAGGLDTHWGECRRGGRSLSK